MKKRILTATLALAMTASLFSGTMMTVNANEELEGTIEVGGWPSGDDAFEAALEGFNEKYPNIEVELVFTDTTAHHQSLQTSLWQQAPVLRMWPWLREHTSLSTETAPRLPT